MKIRPSALAGAWYPSDPRDLKLSVESYIAWGSRLPSCSPPCQGGEGGGSHSAALRGLVLPHAGHKYSGQTCGAGVALARGKNFSKVILIGPSHRMFVRGAVSSGATHFETPLGTVPVDLASVRRLAAAGVFCSDDPHQREHCLEILLPFFQSALKEFQIVPILVGSLSDSDRGRLVEALREVSDDRTLVVASSDFVHYGDDFDYVPEVGPDVRAGVRKIDEGAIDYIRALDPKGLLEYRRLTGATICGIVPIAVLLDCLPEKSHVEFIDYSQSADVTQDTNHMVSYASIAFFSP